MEDRKYKGNLSQENEALWELVKPYEKDWELNFLEMSDYDRVFQKITSSPDWQEDMDRVFLFNVMRERKHIYFGQDNFPEDLVVVPNLFYETQQPDTKGLTEQERRLTIQLNNFYSSDCHRFVRALYDQLFEQIYAIEGWENNPVIVKMHRDLKKFEKRNKGEIRPWSAEEEEEYNEQLRISTQECANRIQKEIQQRHPPGRPMNERNLKYFFNKVHCNGWWHNEKLQKLNKILGSQLRVLRMKQQGTWQSRISHDQSQSNQGLLSRMWAKIWPSKHNEKPVSQS